MVRNQNLLLVLIKTSNYSGFCINFCYCYSSKFHYITVSGISSEAPSGNARLGSSKTLSSPARGNQSISSDSDAAEDNWAVVVNPLSKLKE